MSEKQSDQEQWEREQKRKAVLELAGTLAPPDSQVSLNWQMQDGYGATVQVTMRCAVLEDWPSVMKTRAAFLDAAQKGGWTFPGPVKMAEGLKVAKPDNGIKPPPIQRAQPGADELTFEAETLSSNTSDGKTFWKVKGGRWSKWGVTIWPEALADAGLAVKPGEAYSLKGWTAHYVAKPDGQPEKVVRLTKADDF